MKASSSVLLMGFFVLLSGCVQPPEGGTISERVASEGWSADGIVGENEYSRTILLMGPARSGYTGGDLEVSWRNDQEHLYMALKGRTEGWISIGFDPLEWMKDADMIMGSVDGGKTTVLDLFSTGRYGPHEDDTFLGGTYDILEFAGSEEDGYTVIEFKRKLDTGDEFDKLLEPGESVSVIWAMADLDSRNLKHNVAYGEAILPLAQDQVPGSAVATLTPREAEGVLFIWEEEKVARDLYAELYRAKKLEVFLDLERSEQSHMDQAKTLVDKYQLVLPVGDEPGAFSNQTLIDLYEELLARGMRSEEDALRVAAAFEEISIMDLEKELEVAENEDVRVVFQGLLAGSRKHLRSYVRDLEDMGIMYAPQFLSEREFEDVMKA